MATGRKRTGRLWCQDVSQDRRPIQEGKAGAWDLELQGLGFVLAHMLDFPCPKSETAKQKAHLASIPGVRRGLGDRSLCKHVLFAPREGFQ